MRHLRQDLRAALACAPFVFGGLAPACPQLVFGGVALAAMSAIVHPPAAFAGPVTVNPAEPRWLVQDGAPFYFCGPGDPENFLHRGTRNADGTRNGDQNAIIQEMIGTGANILWMTAIRSHGGDGGTTENPFINNDPNLGVSAAVLDQWEGWISALDAAGIVTFFVFYDDGTLVWNTGDAVGSAENAFLQALVNRFESYDHVIWCVCEEFEEAFSMARVSAIAATIAGFDDANHPIAGHQHENTVFHFANDPNLDAHAMHAGAANTPASLHTKVLQARANSQGSYHLIMAESINQWSGDRTAARKLSWAAAMGGATVMVHGLTVADTPVEGLQDCGRLRSFFTSVPFSEMAPADPQKRGTTEYVYGAPGVGYILYSAAATSSLGLNSAASEGPVDLKWLDPATGVTVEEAGTLNAGDNFWAKPGGIGLEAALSVLPTAATPVSGEINASSFGRIKAKFLSR